MTCDHQGFAVVFSESTNALFDNLRTRIRNMLFTQYQISLEPFEGDNHITLVQQMRGVTRSDAEKVLEQLAHIYGMYSKTPNFIVKPSAQPFFYQPCGWLFFNVDLTDAMSNFHTCAANFAVNHMQKGSPDKLPRGIIEDNEIEAWNAYGYRYMYASYTIPHVTIGRMKTDEDICRFNVFMESIMAAVDGMVRDIFDGSSSGIEVAGFTHYGMGHFGSHAATLSFRPVV